MRVQVQLDLADELQSAFPPGLRPYVQHICVRATSYKQLKGLSDRLSGIPSAAALELGLSFGRKESLNLGNVRTFIRRAGLTERVRAVKYCCKSVLGTTLFPGRETPVCAELWPGYTNSQPAAFWRILFSHSLVELQITVGDPEHALHGLKSALRCGERICGTLRSLQVDRIYNRQVSLPLSAVTDFLAGLKLPCLEHLGSFNGVTHCFTRGCEWPEKGNLPTLQAFGSTRKPAGIFGLGRSGVHFSLGCNFGGIVPLADMAAMANSALGPATKELHITASRIDAVREGLMAAVPFGYEHGIALLSCVQQLSIKGGWEHHQLLVRAEAINAFKGLQKLALGGVTLEGHLTGPCLTQIVCSSRRTQLLTVLARPPPALTSILVPHMRNAVVPRAVLGIDVPRVTEVVRACPGGPRWKVSHESCKLWVWEWECMVCIDELCIDGLIKAVPFTE